MKKLLFAVMVISLSAATNVHAWIYNFKNDTDLTVRAKVQFSGIQPTIEFLLAARGKRVEVIEKGVKTFSAGDTYNLNSYVSCANKIEVWPDRTNQITSYTPPSTGFGMDCSNENFVITQGSDGKLVVRTTK